MINICSHKIGFLQPVYVVAEMSANHNGSIEKAIELVHVAKRSGADAVKVQTYTPDTLTIKCNRPEFIVGEGSPWQGRTLYDLYSEAYMPWAWQPRLQAEAQAIGLDFFSTPFDASAVEFLESMNIPAYKIASFELVDIPLLQCVARTGKPVILSTGMATVEEIEEAVQTIRNEGNNQVALLKCTSAYPASPSEMNLRTIPDMAKRFHVPVGLSDHSMDPLVPVVAAAMGACIIEKHLTLSRSGGGPDDAFSLEPDEFLAMTKSLQTVQQACGTVNYAPSETEKAGLVFRRSLFAVENIKAGERFTEKNVRSIRPGHGMPPKYFKAVLNCSAACHIERGTPLQPYHVMGQIY